jgi:hypothetical protein
MPLEAVSIVEVSDPEPETGFKIDADRNRKLDFDLTGETFFAFDYRTRKGLGGLAHIMFDIDIHLTDIISVTGAFHFDTSPWQNFLNKPAAYRQENKVLAYDIKIEAEEFFIKLSQPIKNFDVYVGRMFSYISYANQLHVNDFQYNIKPRIFTDYWGNNHGFSLDGLRARLFTGRNNIVASLFIEAAKAGEYSENKVITAIADATFDLGTLQIGLRGFSYFDHQTSNHPMLRYLPLNQVERFNLRDEFGLNSHGIGFRAKWHGKLSEPVLFQTEWMNRRVSKDFYSGGYAFLIIPLKEKLMGSIMFQQLENAVLYDDDSYSNKEKAATLGLWYLPITDHRLRLEHSRYFNSLFYRSLTTIKWTFAVNLSKSHPS